MGYRAQKRFTRVLSDQLNLNEEIVSEVKKLRGLSAEQSHIISIHEDLFSRTADDQVKVCELLKDNNKNLVQYIGWVNELKREMMQLYLVLWVFIIVCFAMIGIYIWY